MTPVLLGLSLALTACDDPSGGAGGADAETEEITQVTLTFTTAGADPIVVSFIDEDGEGGTSGTADALALAADTTYAVSVQFLDTLSGEDITAEIEAEAEDHQVLFYGDSVTGPASMGDGLLTHAYADAESDYGPNAVGEDLPVGLENTITTGAAGMGSLQVMLRHLPELNGSPQKVSDLAEMFAASGTAPGEIDANVRFSVTVAEL